MNPTCAACGEEMQMSLVDVQKPMTTTAWGSPRFNDEWRCVNGHRRPVTDAEDRLLE